MIVIPFIYFSSLFFRIYKKNGFDVSAYITMLYMITGLFSIILSFTDREYGTKEISFLPTIIYCGLISLTIYPFYCVKSNKRSFNPNNVNIKLFDYIVYFYIFSFIFTIILFWNDLIFRLTFADFKEMRGSDDLIMQTAQSKLGGPLRAISSIFGIFNSMSWITLLFFFYSICFLKKKRVYNLLLLLSSTSCIILGIIGIDRSIVYYWFILLGLSYTIFKNYIPAKEKKSLTIAFGTIIGILLTYFIAVTISRFGDDGADKQGAIDSVVSYAGQNFINFCWFWDNFQLPEINLSGIFPATFRYILGNAEGTVNYGQILEFRLGYFVNYFYTFLGSWMIYIGQEGSILLSVIYTICTYRILCRNQKNLYFDDIIRMFILIIVPLCGAILFIYTSYMRTISACVLFLVSYKLVIKKRLIR